MLSRSAGTSASSSNAAAAIVVSSSKWRRIAVCRSSSVGTADLVARSKNQSVGVMSLSYQHVERRHVGVPFDQGRDWAEAAQRFRIERPNVIDHARAMIVDPQCASIRKFADAVAGEMNLTDCQGGQMSNIGGGIASVIFCADIDVVDVAEDAASGARRNRGHKFPFGDGRVSELHVGGRILDQNSTPKPALHLIDIAADRRQRLLGHRQRQQIGKIVAAADAPGDMLGDKRRFDTLGDLLDTIEVRNVETVCAPQREPNAVQRYRKITANDLKTAYRLPTAH